MKTNHLEPGLLPIFRWFSILRLIMLALGSYGILFSVVGSRVLVSAQFHWINLALGVILTAYLFWQPVQARLGRYFLPVGIILAVAGPELEQFFNLTERAALGGFPPLVGAWQMVPILLVPLVLVSAQYRFRSVVIYSIATHLIDMVTFIYTLGNNGRELLPTFSVLSLRTVSFLLVGYSIVQLMNSQRRQRQELSQANQQMARYASTLEQLTISRERNRLARELHDTLAHSLSGLAVQLEAVRSIWDDDPAASRAMIDQALAATRSGLTETRRALQALRATPIEDLGLALAVKNLTESFTKRTGLTVNAVIREDLPTLSPSEEQCVYRVAQEALENVRRHAEASWVKLRLEPCDGAVQLTISDDGKGFDADQSNISEHYGLSGMRERTEEAGGRLDITSRPGLGTHILLVCGGR